MKERPILFSGPMVRAILDGRKTQTRRPVKWPVLSACDGSKRRVYTERAVAEMNERLETRQRHPCHQFCPLGQPGDRLWVRETWRMDPWNIAAEYRATTSAMMEHITPWRPSIHMPRWASRIRLEVTRVWVERVQDISRGDAMAEGCPFANMSDGPDPRSWFGDLWQSIYGTWAANPWVWAVEFRRAKP